MARPSIQLQGGRRPPRRRNFNGFWFLALLALAAIAVWVWYSYKARSKQSTPPQAIPAVADPVQTPTASAVQPASSTPIAGSNAVVPRRIPSPLVPPATHTVPESPPPASTPTPAPSPTSAPPESSGTHSLSNRIRVPLKPEEEPGSLPATNSLALQMALAAQGFSCGSLDGLPGAQTGAALRAFQLQQGIEETGRPDPETVRRLHPGGRLLVSRTITTNDLEHLHPVPATWLGKSQVRHLDFESILEQVAEESHAHPRLIQRLNPTVNFGALTAETVLIVPRVDPLPVHRAALIRISLSQRWLRAYDDHEGLLLQFPCSIGRMAEKRPVGTLHVVVTVKDPNYTFDPSVFPESPEAHQTRTKLIIAPGPNNPVGVAWIGLDRPGFGIHGTPSPEQVGRTESHGCFRLANWNAELLRQRVAVGTPVVVEP